MRGKILLLGIGLALVIAGVFFSTQTIQINEGNQCTVDGGCRNVTASVPTVAIGALVIVAGLVVAVIGLRRTTEDQ